MSGVTNNEPRKVKIKAHNISYILQEASSMDWLTVG